MRIRSRTYLQTGIANAHIQLSRAGEWPDDLKATRFEHIPRLLLILAVPHRLAIAIHIGGLLSAHLDASAWNYKHCHAEDTPKQLKTLMMAHRNSCFPVTKDTSGPEIEFRQSLPSFLNPSTIE
jgi:hypothetical protein